MDLDAIIAAAPDKRSKKEKQRAQLQQKKKGKAAKKVRKDAKRFDRKQEYDALDKVMDSVTQKRKSYGGNDLEEVRDVRKEEESVLVEHEVIKGARVEDEVWEETIDTETGKFIEPDYEEEDEDAPPEHEETKNEKHAEKEVEEIDSTKIVYVNQIPRLCIRDKYLGIKTFSVIRDVDSPETADLDLTVDFVTGFVMKVIRLIITSSTPCVVVPKSSLMAALDDMKIKRINTEKFIMLDTGFGLSNYDGIIYCFYLPQDIMDEFADVLDFVADINRDINGDGSEEPAVFDLFYEIYRYYDGITFSSFMTDNEWLKIASSFTDVDSYIGKIIADGDTEFFLSEEDEYEISPFMPVDIASKEINEYLGYTDEDDSDGGVDHDQNPFLHPEGKYGRAVPTEGGGSTDGNAVGETERDIQEEKEKETQEEKDRLGRYDYDGAGIESGVDESGYPEVNDDDIEKALQEDD